MTRAIYERHVDHATLLDPLCKVLLVRPSFVLGVTDRRPDTLADSKNAILEIATLQESTYATGTGA